MVWTRILNSSSSPSRAEANETRPTLDVYKRQGLNGKIQRILLHEITKDGVKEAIEHPTELNRPLFDAQQARRVLDRLVGYRISPILWDKVKRGISAGRVQSVALRIIVEREKEREAFRAEEYCCLLYTSRCV